MIQRTAPLIFTAFCLADDMNIFACPVIFGWQDCPAMHYAVQYRQRTTVASAEAVWQRECPAAASVRLRSVKLRAGRFCLFGHLHVHQLTAAVGIER